MSGEGLNARVGEALMMDDPHALTLELASPLTTLSQRV